jgi:hypothetical protein
MAIHFPGLKNTNVVGFPDLAICLDCGDAGFAVPEPELRQLAAKDDAAEAARHRVFEPIHDFSRRMSEF